MLCYAMLCYAMLCYAMLCYAMLCYAMLCYAMLCYAMLCYAMLFYSLFFSSRTYGNTCIYPSIYRCPKCRSPIEKNGGCMHMTCRIASCAFEFCWLCRGPWTEHG